MTETLLGKAIAGERRALAKLLTAVENGEINRESLGIENHLDDGTIIGLTGAPGVGKSCLIEKLLSQWSSDGLKVAVIAVDPSSPLSGGALLGDRVRMDSADSDLNVFVRSFATRNQPGGLPVTVGLAANLMRNCGYDYVLIETVGAGQAEIRIVSFADRVVLVESPSRGDQIQAEKAGVMELADLIVVNKSDLEGSERAASEISMALEISGNPPPVLLASAKTGAGISDFALQLQNIPVKRGAEVARARERLLSAWDSALLSRGDISEVLNNLACGDESAQEWVEQNLRWFDE
ncbi:MAG TPA: GTP-binding protein [Candidatus Thalassarchaeaceae archaeon]|nr:GTP-binding protein [Candidatus Thalassarchaeaceae archaeon]HJL58901.1 GTP-binding protein [Candidatus Thalassarchaeaceae archaeon]HJM19805.1 GTP-binding protein [Candidatus Thalassarchaeaceae archaeon]